MHGGKWQMSEQGGEIIGLGVGRYAHGIGVFL